MRGLARSDNALAASLSAAAILVYALSSGGYATAFDYFGRLSAAFMGGHWWLTDAPDHLIELVPCGVGRFCVPFPPMPAIVALPFVAVLSPGTGQMAASIVAGGLSAFPTFLSLRRLGADRALAAVTTTFAVLGTCLWFTASTGSAWYLAHAVAVLFAAMGVLLALDGRPGWVVGAALGAAALSRPPVALAAIGLAIVVARVRRMPTLAAVASVAAGMLPFAVIELAYDLLRWGTPVEAGYGYLAASPLNDSTPYGLFSPLYVPDHLYAMLLRPPGLTLDLPFPVRPSLHGTSILLISPAFLFLVPAMRHRVGPIGVALLAAGSLALVPDLLHGGVGASQFGYRFSLDAQPFVIPLFAQLSSASGVRRSLTLSYAGAVGWSVLANLYGLAAIRAGFT